jgi:hypothetical protein
MAVTAGLDAFEEWIDLGQYLQQLRMEHADLLDVIEALKIHMRNLLQALELEASPPSLNVTQHIAEIQDLLNSVETKRINL